MRDAHYRRPAGPRGAAATGVVARRDALAAAACGLLLALVPASGRAATLVTGEVLQIGGPAAFVVRADGGRRVAVRLAGVVAATGREAAAARKALARLVFGRRVRVRAADAGQDPLIGRVDVGGVDVAATLVANGWLRADGAVPGLREHEAAARRLGLGIWSRR